MRPKRFQFHCFFQAHQKVSDQLSQEIPLDIDGENRAVRRNPRHILEHQLQHDAENIKPLSFFEAQAYSLTAASRLQKDFSVRFNNFARFDFPPLLDKIVDNDIKQDLRRLFASASLARLILSRKFPHS